MKENQFKVYDYDRSGFNNLKLYDAQREKWITLRSRNGQTKPVELPEGDRVEDQDHEGTEKGK